MLCIKKLARRKHLVGINDPPFQSKCKMSISSQFCLGPGLVPSDSQVAFDAGSLRASDELLSLPPLPRFLSPTTSGLPPAAPPTLHSIALLRPQGAEGAGTLQLHPGEPRLCTERTQKLRDLPASGFQVISPPPHTLTPTILPPWKCPPWGTDPHPEDMQPRGRGMLL